MEFHEVESHFGLPIKIKTPQGNYVFMKLSGAQEEKHETAGSIFEHRLSRNHAQCKSQNYFQFERRTAGELFFKE